MNVKEFWRTKSHDIPIQQELDEVKDDVHELDGEDLHAPVLNDLCHLLEEVGSENVALSHDVLEGVSCEDFADCSAQGVGELALHLVERADAL